ncbi:MAG: transglutaminase-like domain-containing protein [Candidatus Micrarchaeia archaeon]|jgi:hypothetical protein
MEEWHKEGGHPCIPYLEVYKERIRTQELESKEALERLTSSRRYPRHEEIAETNVVWKAPYNQKSYEDSQMSRKIERYIKCLAIAVLAMIVLFVVLLQMNSVAGSAALLATNCADGTPNGQCSSNRPFYCSNGNISERADLCGCPPNSTMNGEFCEEAGRCADNTSTEHCSQNQPLYCLDGILTNRADLCGCSGGLIENGTTCVEPPHCEDGTLYDSCSDDKPLYCSEGNLIQKARTCGCPLDYVTSGESCVSRYMTSPKQISLEYTLRGQKRSIDYTVYGGLNNYLANKPRSVVCSFTCPSQGEMELSIIDEPLQEEHLRPLIWAIEHETDNEDDQARIAISLVQSIPYDWDGLYSGDLTGRYPYEVLYDQKGVCGEKAKLLAFLLRELGYGTVLLNYEEQSHEAVGIKCPTQYGWEHSGHCFIESTVPSIVTDDQGEYVGVGELVSEPNMIFVNDGASFDSVSEEYSDARDFIRIRNELEGGDVYQDWSDYTIYSGLIEKYGMEIDES